MTLTKRRVIVSLGILVTIILTTVLYIKLSNTYRGQGYVVRYPSGWEILNNQYVDVVFTAPLLDPNKAFRSNVTMVVVPTSSNVSIDGDHFSKLIEYLDKPENYFHIIEKHETIINELRASTLKYDTGYSGLSLRVTTYMISGRKTYIFTYTSLKEVHEELLDQFMSIVTSLHEL